jgi:hypothetical protein
MILRLWHDVLAGTGAAGRRDVAGFFWPGTKAGKRTKRDDFKSLLLSC